MYSFTSQLLVLYAIQQCRFSVFGYYYLWDLVVGDVHFGRFSHVCQRFYHFLLRRVVAQRFEELFDLHSVVVVVAIG